MQIDKNDPNFAYIIPYRETITNEKEFLFYKKNENDSFTSFSGKIIETDPTPLFSASRIMLSILYDYKLEILEKV